jgi:hypothetical protein
MDRPDKTMKLKRLVSVGTPILASGYLNLKPECAQIGNTLLCTHFQDVSLLKLDTTLSMLTVQYLIQPHGNYKIAACKSKNVFFVATDDSILAVDLSGAVLGSHRCVDRFGINEMVPLSLACDDDKVSVIHTDDEHEMLTMLRWNMGAFAMIGELDMTRIGIDASRHAAITSAPGYDLVPPSTARLLSPLHFTALRGSANVPTLFEIVVSASGAMQLYHYVRKVGLPVGFRCFANLESATRPPAFGVCALLEDAPVRGQPPSLEIFAYLQTPRFKTNMIGTSIALCSSNENHQLCTCRVVEDDGQFHLTVEIFEFRPRAFASEIAMRLAHHDPSTSYPINPDEIYPSGKKKGGYHKKRKTIKRKVRKSRKH